VELPFEFTYEKFKSEGDGRHEPYYPPYVDINYITIDWDVASEMAGFKIESLADLKKWILERYHDDVVLEIKK